MDKKRKFIILFLFFLIAFTKTASAISIDELKAQIEAKQKEKAALEAENIKLQAQIEQTSKQANTLQNAVKTLDTTQKKLQNDLQVTKTKISKTQLAISKINIEISETQKKIDSRRRAIADILRNLQDTSSTTLIETFLQYKNTSDLWDNVETTKRFQEAIRQSVIDLTNLKEDLSDKKIENESTKKELTGLSSELTDKKAIVDQNKQAKTTLLNQTKNKEAEYKAMLARNIELGKKFEQELFNYESQLRVAIDPSQLPSTRPGILSWPLDSVLITQRFGKTVDSKRLYVSGTHNGVDFKATVGTQVRSVYGGIVKGIGNTDDQSGCYSYGRWVLIEHPNGLSSLYAHLSRASVSTGQNVETGTIIGYSGGQPGVNGSGYSTGPHLHLGLYATQGVTIQKYTQSKFCKQVSIPVAGANAYLDPLAYLPALP